MSKYPPNDYDEPYIGDPLPMGEAHEYKAGFQDGYETAAARIAELEAERADYITETEALVVRVRGESAARIGELEVKNKQRDDALNRYIEIAQAGKARIAELEVTLASYDAGVSDREKLVWEELNARIVELEAERDRLLGEIAELKHNGR